MILFTPGPVMTSDAVRQAAAQPDMNHREPAFQELLSRLRHDLLDLYQADETHDCLLIGGSGTSAMEAMACSCVDQGSVLLITNGYFSERFASILEVHRIPHLQLSHDWLQPIDLDRVEAALRGAKFEAVLVAHGETTVGWLNPIAQIAELAHRHGARILVDAISTFGAEHLELGELDAVCAVSNKCLHAHPGVGIVLVRKDLATQMAAFPRRSYYLHLPMYLPDAPPLTAPVPLLRSLGVALDELRQEGGPKSRLSRYQLRADTVRKAMDRFGAHLVTPAAETTAAVSTFRLPPGWDAQEFLRANRAGGYELYGCKGELAGTCVQIAHMGELPPEEPGKWTGFLADF